MFSLRDLIIFLAGAEFFHTLTHLFFAFFVPLPLDLKFIILTKNLNTVSIIVNAIVTILLIWWSYRLS